MNAHEWLLLGYVLGAVPAARLATVVVAWLAKRVGLSPREMGEYSDAASGDGSE